MPKYAQNPTVPGEPPRDGRNWLIRVESQAQLDLELLLEVAQDNEIRAVKMGEAVYVDWEMLRPKMPFGPASHAAERFVPVLNGIMAVRFPAFNGLRVRSILGTSEDGQWIPVSWTTVRVGGQVQTNHADEYLKNGGATLGRLYRLAVTNAAVAEALLYLGRGREPFFDLYKAFEVVRDTVGGEGQLQALGLASRNDCERFTRSANDPAISGVFARHSQKLSTPIAHPMDEHEAREFVRRLVERWTDHLLAQDESGAGKMREPTDAVNLLQ